MKYKIKLKLQHLTQGYQWVVPCKVNDKNCLFLIDNGASITVLDTDFYESIKIKDNIKQPSFPVAGIGGDFMSVSLPKVKSLKVGLRKFKNRTVATLSLDSFNSMRSICNLEPIHGLIGADILYQDKAIIDFSKSLLILTKQKSKKGVIDYTKWMETNWIKQLKYLFECGDEATKHAGIEAIILKAQCENYAITNKQAQLIAKKIKTT